MLKTGTGRIILGLAASLAVSSAQGQTSLALSLPPMLYTDARGSSSAVLFAPRVDRTAPRPSAFPAPELSRNDGALNRHASRAITAIDDWPEARRDSLRYSRRETLPTNARTIIYFDRGPRRRTPYRLYGRPY
ncbi:MAG: hypothetical protein AAFR38_08110 [Planctomycetota bacterium]